MKILKFSVNGNPYVALFIKLIKDSAIVTSSVDDKWLQKMRDTGLEVIKINAPVVTPYILETPNRGFILSKNAPEELINILNSFGEVCTVESKKNLLGNLLVIGKNGILYSKYKDKDILDFLTENYNLTAYQVRLSEYPLIGGLIKVYKNGALISQYIPEKYWEKIKEVLGVETLKEASVNFGGAYIRYGFDITEKLLIVGDKTTGHELIRIEETFKS